ncbi:vWA domain-containing protein [Adhaeribacter aquaticus]|uniref:vWA domain-containing protein n=1 Tax=Adhaeribacter aquaticus TaxID=299567 RepID=UPI000478A8CA|nr:VWA domain-containing protein [Adhaeribacter aquaticus]
MSIRRILAILFLVFCLVSSTWVSAQNTTPPPQKTRILFMLDMSGSMQAKWETSTRVAVAKVMLSRLVDSLQHFQNLELGLRVYGHLYPKEANNCKDTKLEVPFSEGNESQIITRLKQITPKGNTPITYSLTQAANDFPPDKNARNITIIITDGLESCGGDPCAASLALQQKRIFLRPFVIGIGADTDWSKQFSCVGQYFDAANIHTFSNILSDVVNLALNKTTVSVDLTDEKGKPIESNVNLTFKNSITGQPEYNYVHYREQNGNPDVLDIDAMMSYDLVINTVPPIELSQLAIKPGKHNVFSVKAPQGILYLRQDNPSSYGQVQAILKQKGATTNLLALPFGSQQKVLAGNYDIEILTLPRIQINNYTVKPGVTNTITYPPPGILNIPNELQGYGSIYTLSNTGAQEWIYNLPEGNSKTNLPLQPGKYRIVYRSKFAKGSNFTDVQDFEIRSAVTTTIKLFTK